MLPPPQSATMSSWLSFPARRWASIVSGSLMCSSPHNACKHALTVVLVCDVLGLACFWIPHLTSCRTWTPKTRMRIPWTNWKDRRLCLVVFAKATIGPPAVRTRTPWAPCRRSWLNSLDFLPETRTSPLALVPSAHHSHHQILILFFCDPLFVRGWLFLMLWLMWPVFLFSHQRNQSLHSLLRARLGSMCPRAWGMEARGEGSPCSRIAEVGVSCCASWLFTPILYLSHCSIAQYKPHMLAPNSWWQRHYSCDQSVWGHPWDRLAGALQTIWLHLEDLSGQG